MQKGVHWGLVKINRLPFMTLLFTTCLCLDPCHTSSLSLSIESKHRCRRMDPIGHKAFDPNIGTAKTLAENNLHAGTRYPSPLPLSLYLYLSLSLGRRYSKCEIISPPLIHAQPAGSRANPSHPLPSSLPPSSSNSVQSDPNERITRNYDTSLTHSSLE